MNAPIKDGGPAFPESYIGADSPHEGVGNGMTLRDYFAAKALGVAFTHASTNIGAGSGMGYLPEEWAAKIAYSLADAMLAARETKS